MLCFFLFAFRLILLCGVLYLDINLSFIYRYSVEKIPLYDSAEDELSQQTATSADFTYDEKDMMEVDHKINSTRMNVDPLVSVPANGVSSSIRPKKKLKRLPKGKSKNLEQRELNAKYVVSLLETKEAQQEILTYEVQTGILTSDWCDQNSINFIFYFLHLPMAY